VIQARDRALNAVLDKIDIPLPESVVRDEVKQNRDSVSQQLDQAGATLDRYLEMSNQTEEQFEADLEQRARRAVKVTLVLDELAREEELSLDQADLSAYVTRQAEQLGVAPERLAQQLADSGRLSAAAGEVLRAKALNVIAERVKVTDQSGHEIDVQAALNAPVGAADAAESAAGADDDGSAAGADDAGSAAGADNAKPAAEADDAGSAAEAGADESAAEAGADES
jgi:FKBP-type peptidyl-prolyl cis-trans isomerase (trigger factor)